MNKIKKFFEVISGVSLGTWVRLVLLLLAFVNLTLQSFGVRTIPVDSENVGAGVSIAFAAVCAAVSYWENNSFTQAAQTADKVLRGELTAIESETNENKVEIIDENSCT